jgi:L-ascorbate metabolism protein UlaG (beta-lactamase superfamily)
VRTRWKKALIVLAGTCIALAVAAYLVFQLPAFGGKPAGSRLERVRRSPEFIGGRFENTPPQRTDSSLLKTYRLYSQGQIREPRIAIPVVPISPDALKSPASRELRAAWFGHASVLVELDGVRIMTDPVFSDAVSPVPPIGPERFHRPPIALEDVTGIDAVVISHDHYDHLDMKTVQHLAPQGTHFYVPLGIGAHLQRWGVPRTQIHEMDWWQEARINGVRIVCTPARHYSGRKRMNNPTLWASWTIRGTGRNVYFSGDTGYAGHFKEIRRRLGRMDLTLMKIGAYGETWLDIHMDPESAVQAHLDLDADTLLPIHWATFNLSYHSWDEPIVRTLSAARKNGARVITPKIGEVVEYGRPFLSVAWYDR